jgi:hypothetical protein
MPKGVFEIIYKSVVMRSDSTQMDLNCFFEAVEELSTRLFGPKDPFDNLQRLL